MRNRDRVTLIASAAAIAAAVLAVGGAPRWSLAVIAVPTVVAVAAQVSSRRGVERVTPLLVVLGIALGVTALQAIPLPVTARATLDPVNHELIEDGRALTGDGPSTFAPLSLDPPATRRAALDLALAFAIAWVLLRAATSGQGRYWILAGVAATCGLAATVGAVDQLFNVTTLYGLYTPRHGPVGGTTVLGPLINANSYGSLLVLGAMVSAGLALHAQQANLTRACWALNIVLCLAVAFATLSRGAAIAAGIGTVTTVAVWLSTRRTRERNERRRPHLIRVTVPAIVLVLCGLALVVMTSAGGVSRQLDETSVSEINDPNSKYVAWRSSTELVRESPWIGVGRGGFEPAFTRVHPESAFGTFSHVENEYLQAVIDWGVPTAAALAFAIGWLVLVVARRRADGPLAAGAIGGLAAIAAQATVDFGLEFPGLLLPTVAVAATLSYGPLREMKPSAVRRSFALRLGLLAAIVGLVVLVVPPWGATLADDHDALAADDPPDYDAARAVMERHPLDYFAPARAAMALFDKGDPGAIKHLNRALVLHPTHPGLHRMAAKVLAATGHGDQAKLEFQTAMRYTQDPTKLVGEVLAVFPKAEDASSALWLDYPRPAELARTLQEWKRSDVMLRYLQQVVNRPLADTDTIDLLWTTALDIGDLDAAEAGARLRLARVPGLKSRLVLGRVLRLRKKLADAENVLAPAIGMPGAPIDVVASALLLCDVQIDREEWTAARSCLRKAMTLPNITVPSMREIHTRLATVADAVGDKYSATMERALAQGLLQGER